MTRGIAGRLAVALCAGSGAVAATCLWAGGAAALPTVGPPDTPVASPVAACDPAPERQCLAVPAKLGPAVGELLAVSDRRGLGISPASRIVGVAAARKARDTLLDGFPGKPARARALFTDAAGSVPGGRVVDSFTSSGSARRGRAGILWRYRFDAAVDRCPDPGPASNSHGKSAIDGRAYYLIQTRELRGRSLVVTDISIELRIAANPYVNRRAEFDGADDAGAPARQALRITRHVRVIDPNGRTRDLDELAITLYVRTFVPQVGVTVEADPFEAWIQRQERQERGEPPPDVDGPIIGPVWKQFAAAFTRMTARRILDLVKPAERYWRIPGNCVTVAIGGPGALAPGTAVPLRGLPRSTARPASPEQLLGSATYDAKVVLGQSLRNLVPSLPLPAASPWVEYRAPNRRWTASSRPGVELTFLSKGGIGKATKLFDPLDDTLYYEIVSASGSSSFAQTNECANGGRTVQHPIVDDWTMTGQEDPPRRARISTLDDSYPATSAGILTVENLGAIRGTVTGTCRSDPSDCDPCEILSKEAETIPNVSNGLSLRRLGDTVTVAASGGSYCFERSCTVERSYPLATFLEIGPIPLDFSYNWTGEEHPPPPPVEDEDCPRGLECHIVSIVRTVSWTGQYVIRRVDLKGRPCRTPACDG